MKKEILKQYFGYDDFREGQSEIIDALLIGRDALGVMPTGAGKSLCYQIPSMILPHVTLVISPLISLMRDQVQALVANGIPAAFINSSLTDAQREIVINRARKGQYKIIYVAPERLLAPSILQLAQSLSVSLIAVDEAHCISQWGQDFRPSYLDIPRFVEALSVRPIVTAFTATATSRVREDILRILDLREPLTLVTSFDRPNLYFDVKRPQDKYSTLTAYLRENEGRGIIYCSTRKEVESVTEKLVSDGYSVSRYHAGLSDDERNSSQDDFLYDRVRLIVATNAFGMGIDKSNVRFVIHYNMPQNVESYYQEAGRAGRDGLSSDCILFYARKDINTALYLINKSENQDEVARNRQLLNRMEEYCETDGCLRRYILRYFGERIEDDCGNCGNCDGDFDEIDITVDAQKVLSNIARLNRAGKSLMFTHTANILLGKSDDFTDLSTFGIMKGVTRHYIRSIVNRLTSLGFIRDNNGYLSVTPKAYEVLSGGVVVTIRENKAEPSEKTRRTKNQNLEHKYALSEELLAKLKELRGEIAREENVQAYIVFSDATLVDMCQKHPQAEDEMLNVSGVGRVKLERYGARFLDLLNREAPNVAPLEKPPVFTSESFFEQIEISDEPLQISRVADNLNAVFLRYDKPKTSGIKLNKLLIEATYLETVDGVKLPTNKGRELGITVVDRNSDRGPYKQCLFDARAQRVCAELALNEME
ncbi:ATP-dependent DNA helicase RecQ [Synergistales bacterium]|nr:ATP-dependent DNA helicase RecQ [Synergistales bacterium]